MNGSNLPSRTYVIPAGTMVVDQHILPAWKTEITAIVIPEGVTSIGEWAFYNCKSLTSIVIPESVSSIGESAFWNCESLTSIVIPEGVTSIGANTFSVCKSLTSIVIPKGVTSIGKGAFGSCKSLTSIVIPDSVTSIDVDAFNDCKQLKNFDISEQNPCYRAKESMLLSKDGSVVHSCPAAEGSIVIPEGVTDIGENAFAWCSNLTSVVIPDGVTNIGEWAFSSCKSLTSIVIPESVTSIGEGAFSGCDQLKNLDISEQNPCYRVKESMILSKDGSVVHSFPAAEGSVVIPEGVTSIGEAAFTGCSNLSSVVIPEGVTSIGEEAFFCCENLTSIVIPESVTSIGEEAFLSCGGLDSIVIPDSVTSIGANAFGFVGHIIYNGPAQSEDNWGANRRNGKMTQANGGPFTLGFHFQGHQETDLEKINAVLAQHALSELNLEEYSGYLAKETTTKHDTGEENVRYWYGLDDCVLGCTPATAQDSFTYQISTMTMEKTEMDCAARWREANPGRAMRTMVQIEYEDRYALIVLHHEKTERTDAAECEQAENHNEQELQYAETEAYMKTFIGRMHAASSYKEMKNLLSEGVREEELKEIDNITYSCGDYIIGDLLSFGMKEQITILKMFNEKYLRIFPEYIDSQFFGDFCIRIIRIDGTNGEELIPFRQGYQLLSEEDKLEGYKDIERLVRANLFVRSILSERYNPLMITPVTHRLVLGFWMHLDIIKAEEAEGILDDVYRLIFGKER